MIYKTSNGIDIEVVVIRKKNKNLYFRVKEDLKLYVSAPMYLSAKSILNLIKENESSILKMYEETLDKSKDNVIKANINNVRLQGSDTKNASHELKRTRNGNLQDNLSKDKNQRNDKDDKNKK